MEASAWMNSGGEIPSRMLRHFLARQYSPATSTKTDCCTAADLDLLSSVLGSRDIGFDLDGNGTVDQEDHRMWVEDVFGTFFGDADLNKEVEFGDFLALADGFGGEGGWANGDFDGNGNVDFPDFLALAANFGRGAAGVAAAVPEPTGACLAVFGVLGLIDFRRRR